MVGTAGGACLLIEREDDGTYDVSSDGQVPDSGDTIKSILSTGEDSFVVLTASGKLLKVVMALKSKVSLWELTLQIPVPPGFELGPAGSGKPCSEGSCPSSGSDCPFGATEQWQQCWRANGDEWLLEEALACDERCGQDTAALELQTQVWGVLDETFTYHLCCWYQPACTDELSTSLSLYLSCECIPARQGHL